MKPQKWYLSYLKKHYGKMIGGMVLVTLVAALSVVNPYISGMIVDKVIEGGMHSLLGTLLLCLIGVTIVKSMLRWGYAFLFEKSSQQLLHQMRSDVYRNLLQQDFSFYNRKRTGDLMARQTGDMDAIRHFTAWVIYNIYENLLLFSFSLIMIFTVDVRLAAAMLAVVPFTILTTYLQSKKVSPAFMNIRNKFSSLNTCVQENISGNRVVKAFAKEDFEIEKFQKENDDYQKAELEAAKVWSRYVPVFEFLSYVLTFILFLYGGYLTIKGEITLGNLVTVNGYLWMLSFPLHAMGWLVNDYFRFTSSVEKIYGTISEEPNLKQPQNPIERELLKGEIEFQNVSYMTDGEDIVKDINFHVKQGQTLGIIGATGSGKSTLMNLLCRFYDTTKGEVLIDGINVKDMDLYTLRDNIGMAMQDIFLFSDTIEGNIAYGRPECTFEEVKKAAIMADANHFIKNTPDGYDTIVGERGMGLSGGQKQRISLARALLKKPSILILDDTTSAVDMETESYIQTQLKKLGKQHTTFIIAYRISSIMDADLILVMDNGKIAERGTHEELLRQQGYYSKIYEHQYPDADTNGKGGNL